MIILKSERELDKMREAGRIVAGTHAHLQRLIEPGVSTIALDRAADRFIRRQGAEAAFKGYRGFPAHICTSINEEVVHGIPSERRILNDGDIISIDIGVIKNGYYGDAARTVAVGSVSAEARRLIEVAEKALAAGIERSCPGNRLSDISHAVQTVVEDHGMSVVREYVGHGIGTEMHEKPQIPNFGPPHRGPVLKQGMTLAIEPMVNLGDFAVTLDGDDEWTVRTEDGTWSAHVEETIAIGDQGPEILTVEGGFSINGQRRAHRGSGNRDGSTS